MVVINTALDGVLIIGPKMFGDKRGYFFNTSSQREFDEKVALILVVTRTCSLSIPSCLKSVKSVIAGEYDRRS